jgi:DNA-binding PadR family transcriptional regulator
MDTTLLGYGPVYSHRDEDALEYIRELLSSMEADGLVERGTRIGENGREEEVWRLTEKGRRYHEQVSHSSSAQYLN